jgi:asparagine synthase (glutamine-hydrolysing)
VCGICGIAPFDSDSTVDAAVLKRMTKIVTHRGPDSSGFHCEPGVGLGIRRLSIIDLQTGDQPISNEDGTIHVVCNGEIYNYTELQQELKAAGHLFRTNADTEVIVHLYEEYGIEFLSRLRGMFGLALWDGGSRSLLLARDRFGIKPLHFATNNRFLCFASEQKSILAVEGIERQLDLQAMESLFAVGFVTGTRTLFRNIFRLSPGHYLLCKQGTVTIHKYWDVSFPPSHALRSNSESEEDWAKALFVKLEESVRLHLRSDVPVGAWLSAGVDSSGIVSLMGRLSSRPVQTFSIGFEDPAFDEIENRRTLNHFAGYNVPNQRIVCRYRDFELLPKAIWHCEDLSTSGLEIPRMMLSELSSRSVKVVLTGEGADEVFGGYSWFHADKYLHPLAFLPLSLRRLMLLGPLIPRLKPTASRVHLAPPAMNSERYRMMVSPSYPQYTCRILSRDVRHSLQQSGKGKEAVALPEAFHLWHRFNQLQYHEIKLRLPDFVIRELDRTSMAHSLEARVPFLDHELVEFCAQIPPKYKMKRLNEKYILRKALRPVLPGEIVQRKKRGLRAPFNQWLRGNLPEFAREMLSEKQIKQKGYFCPTGVSELLEMHRCNKSNVGKHLMGVLVIQLWDEIFLRHPQGVNLP